MARWIDAGRPDQPNSVIRVNDGIEAKVVSLFGQRIVTIDIDGTVFSPDDCCPHLGDVRVASQTCSHMRHDVVDKIRRVIEATNADGWVVLSWRAGLLGSTRRWVEKYLEPALGSQCAAYFIPGSPHDIAWLGGCVRAYEPNKKRWGASQTAFKASTALALRKFGVEVIASFEDAVKVTDALERECGVAIVVNPKPLRAPAGTKTASAGWHGDRYNADDTPRHPAVTPSGVSRSWTERRAG